jgi:hypothetical protein
MAGWSLLFSDLGCCSPATSVSWSSSPPSPSIATSASCATSARPGWTLSPLLLPTNHKAGNKVRRFPLVLGQDKICHDISHNSQGREQRSMFPILVLGQDRVCYFFCYWSQGREQRPLFPIGPWGRTDIVIPSAIGHKAENKGRCFLLVLSQDRVCHSFCYWSQGKEQRPLFPIGPEPGQSLSFLLLLVTGQKTKAAVSYWSWARTEFVISSA